MDRLLIKQHRAKKLIEEFSDSRASVALYILCKNVIKTITYKVKFNFQEFERINLLFIHNRINYLPPRPQHTLTRQYAMNYLYNIIPDASFRYMNKKISAEQEIAMYYLFYSL